MNYKKHYILLCQRARERDLGFYIEKHHVIPRCMGGTDDDENIVKLTPEEHYVAHQLLVKMYPNDRKLTWAAIRMTHHPNGKRHNNKAYGWLKRKQSIIAKQRTGNKNGSYNKSWYYDPLTLKNIKCQHDDVPEGYIKGRHVSPWADNKKCLVCNKDTGTKKRKYCNEHREQVLAEIRIKGGEKTKERCEKDFNFKKILLNNLSKGRVKGIKRPRDTRV